MDFAASILSIQTPTAVAIGYLILFLVAVGEATPVGGIVIPGQSIVIIGGVMAKFGIFNFWWTLIIASIGAILGDYIGYVVGKKYGYKFLSKYGKYFFFKKEYLKSTKKIMNNHCGKTLIIGRFNMLTRSIAPLVAGTSDVKFSKFSLYAIIGGILWAATFVGLGYAFGQSYEIAAHYIGRISMIGLGIIIAGIAAYYFVNKKRHIYEKFHMKILAINVASFYIFFKLMDHVVNRDLIPRIDVLTTRFIDSITMPFLTKIMDIVVLLTSTQIFAFIVAVFVFALIRKKNHMQAGLFATGVASTALMVYVIKEMIQRPRPTEALMSVPGFSFPSSHAALSAAFFLLIIYAFRRKFKRTLTRTLFVLANLLLIAVVGFSRLYFHVHYFTDVVAGIAFGISAVTFLLLVFKFIASQMTQYQNSRHK